MWFCTNVHMQNILSIFLLFIIIFALLHSAFGFDIPLNDPRYQQMCLRDFYRSHWMSYTWVIYLRPLLVWHSGRIWVIAGSHTRVLQPGLKYPTCASHYLISYVMFDLGLYHMGLIVRPQLGSAVGVVGVRCVWIHMFILQRIRQQAMFYFTAAPLST